MALMLDLVIVGAGPIGIEAGIRARRAGITYLILEQGSVVNAIVGYPTYMTFFTTSERLEVGGHPLVTATDKPTRKEALDYYRKVVQNEGLAVRQHHRVSRLQRVPEGFEIMGHTDRGEAFALRSRFAAVATGYFDTPKLLGVPGEDRPTVSGYYAEPTLLEGAGVGIDPATLTACHSEETFETNVPGLYVLGSAGYGTRTSDVFIENGLVHVERALEDIRRKMSPVNA
mgnify:CR=1 FL=1